MLSVVTRYPDLRSTCLRNGALVSAVMPPCVRGRDWVAQKLQVSRKNNIILQRSPVSRELQPSLAESSSPSHVEVCTEDIGELQSGECSA